MHSPYVESVCVEARNINNHATQDRDEVLHDSILCLRPQRKSTNSHLYSHKYVLRACLSTSPFPHNEMPSPAHSPPPPKSKTLFHGITKFKLLFALFSTNIYKYIYASNKGKSS